MNEPAPQARRSAPVAISLLMNKGEDPSRWITVELTCFAGEGPHKPEGNTWAIRCRGWTLDVDGDWVYEPIPSSRDDEYLARTRFEFSEAMRRAQRAEPA